MKNFASKGIQSVFIVSVIIFISILTGCGQENKSTDHNSMDQKTTQVDSSNIRTGEIDLVAIDKNKDDMVYQDPMDWNVISDQPGKCPLCGMTLKEVTLEKAKENLLKHDFKLKEN
jgi:hypothetical protein